MAANEHARSYLGRAREGWRTESETKVRKEQKIRDGAAPYTCGAARAAAIYLRLYITGGSAEPSPFSSSSPLSSPVLAPGGAPCHIASMPPFFLRSASRSS